ncbi:ribonuclease P protein component [Olivibacter sp. SDN3]|uniref:ribonuclease P protein component n=1 Tax=Olivibacter sp. SDN3 TaxID=2764720 RepID=UPI00165186A7|nr:ribonuclease P protein component [Olivibacter sp. SDN3]QNL50361.1 ribonuclease P protein component [Olivibacter sp. SDN3]
MAKYTFKKEERLCNKRLLKSLFQGGSSFIFYPYKITFTKVQHLSYPAQVVISVPKRRFKRAVDRNLLKRRMRESYRLDKEVMLYPFLREREQRVLIAIQYIGKEIISYRKVHRRMKDALLKFQVEYDKLPLESSN